MGVAALRVLLFGSGLFIAIVTVLSAVRLLVLPRGERDRLAASVVLAVRLMFDLRTRWLRSYEARDRAMALFAPLTLLILLAAWLALVLIGFTAVFWALGIESWRAAFLTSGSSLLTLGFAPVAELPETIAAFFEAAIGLTLVALLIAYLPTMYTAFSRREAAVTMLEVRAGSPPSAVEMIARYHRLQQMDLLADVWVTWEMWFVDLEESHTSLAMLAFFRSPQPEHSWVTAAGAVLDCGALMNAAVDVPHDPQVDLCMRAGYLALRRIAEFFQIAYDPEPKPDDPISVTHAEFTDACDQLAAARVPLKPDREQAWRDFAGWRVNYDTALLGLARLTMAPYAAWSSDRSPAWRHPFLPRRGRTRP
jgi:ABC-type multidrug transport system fused ATPase/permease subunit